MERSLKEIQLKEVQLLAPKAFDELIAAYFKVMWVPHYIIIDKKGTIINANAPQPLDPAFKIIIDKLLNK